MPRTVRRAGGPLASYPVAMLLLLALLLAAQTTQAATSCAVACPLRHPSDPVACNADVDCTWRNSSSSGNTAGCQSTCNATAAVSCAASTRTLRPAPLQQPTAAAAVVVVHSHVCTPLTAAANSSNASSSSNAAACVTACDDRSLHHCNTECGVVDGKCLPRCDRFADAAACATETACAWHASRCVIACSVRAATACSDPADGACVASPGGAACVPRCAQFVTEAACRSAHVVGGSAATYAAASDALPACRWDGSACTVGCSQHASSQPDCDADAACVFAMSTCRERCSTFTTRAACRALRVSVSSAWQRACDWSGPTAAAGSCRDACAYSPDAATCTAVTGCELRGGACRPSTCATEFGAACGVAPLDHCVNTTTGCGPRTCDDYDTEAACGAASVCAWHAAAGVCRFRCAALDVSMCRAATPPTGARCPDGDSAPCRLYPACRVADGACDEPCASRADGTTCSAAIGCTWLPGEPPARCAATCTAHSSVMACRDAGSDCWWDASSAPPQCRVACALWADSLVGCAAQVHCVFAGGTCVARPACAALVDDAACSATAGCVVRLVQAPTGTPAPRTATIGVPAAESQTATLGSRTVSAPARHGDNASSASISINGTAVGPGAPNMSVTATHSIQPGPLPYSFRFDSMLPIAASVATAAAAAGAFGGRGLAVSARVSRPGDVLRVARHCATGGDVFRDGVAPSYPGYPFQVAIAALASPRDPPGLALLAGSSVVSVAVACVIGVANLLVFFTVAPPENEQSDECESISDGSTEVGGAARPRATAAATAPPPLRQRQLLGIAQLVFFSVLAPGFAACGTTAGTFGVETLTTAVAALCLAAALVGAVLVYCVAVVAARLWEQLLFLPKYIADTVDAAVPRHVSRSVNWRGQPYTETFGTWFDAARDLRQPVLRAYGVVELGASLVVAGVAGTLPSTREACMTVNAVCCLAGLLLAGYAAVLRPLRERTDGVFFGVTAALLVLEAMAGLAAVNFSPGDGWQGALDVAGYVALLQYAVLTLEPLYAVARAAQNGGATAAGAAAPQHPYVPLADHTKLPEPEALLIVAPPPPPPPGDTPMFRRPPPEARERLRYVPHAAIDEKPPPPPVPPSSQHAPPRPPPRTLLPHELPPPEIDGPPPSYVGLSHLQYVQRVRPATRYPRVGDDEFAVLVPPPRWNGPRLLAVDL